jgi:hypothetical protein
MFIINIYDTYQEQNLKIIKLKKKKKKENRRTLSEED